jgi:hypothetical protein
LRPLSLRWRLLRQLSTGTAEAPLVKEQIAEAEPSSKDVAAIVSQEDTAATTDTLIPEEPEVTEAQTINELVMSIKEEAAESEEKEKPESVVLIPVVSEDPHKVEDIEDLVQEAAEARHQLETTEHIPEVTQAQEIPETNEPIAVAIEELMVDMEETVDHFSFSKKGSYRKA